MQENRQDTLQLLTMGFMQKFGSARMLLLADDIIWFHG
jgi:hypothetical protein